MFGVWGLGFRHKGLGVLGLGILGFRGLDKGFGVVELRVELGSRSSLVPLK